MSAVITIRDPRRLSEARRAVKARCASIGASEPAMHAALRILHAEVAAGRSHAAAVALACSWLRRRAVAVGGAA